MGLKTERRTIGEHEYIVTQLDAIKGRKVFARFVKLLSPALKTLAEALASMPGLKAGNLDAATNAQMFKGLATLAESLEVDDVDYFCEQFAPATELVIHDEKGERTPKLSTQFALHFAGNYVEMIQWLVFCFEVNFGSFFSELGLRRATSAKAEASA